MQFTWNKVHNNAGQSLVIRFFLCIASSKSSWQKNKFSSLLVTLNVLPIQTVQYRVTEKKIILLTKLYENLNIIGEFIAQTHTTTRWSKNFCPRKKIQWEMISRTKHIALCFWAANTTLKCAFIWLLTRLLTAEACVIQVFVLPVDNSCFACFQLVRGMEAQRGFNSIVWFLHCHFSSLYILIFCFGLSLISFWSCLYNSGIIP